FSLSWLKEHLDTDEPVEKLADKLTMIGLEVEKIDDKAKALAPFTIARVISAEQHPNADRLRVCMVDPGNGSAPVQVVCGAPYAQWAALGDPVFEINLTPNRQDCAGVHGIARDLSAADMGKFRDPGIKPVKGEFPCPVNVTVEDASLCPGFAVRLVRGVKNGASPEWLQRRLSSIGLRPINALVDITNFMTYDRARPLHVFDAGKVSGNLTVRRA